MAVAPATRIEKNLDLSLLMVKRVWITVLLPERTESYRLTTTLGINRHDTNARVSKRDETGYCSAVATIADVDVHNARLSLTGLE